jgi:hypothetical protein
MDVDALTNLTFSRLWTDISPPDEETDVYALTCSTLGGLWTDIGQSDEETKLLP